MSAIGWVFLGIFVVMCTLPVTVFVRDLLRKRTKEHISTLQDHQLYKLEGLRFWERSLKRYKDGNSPDEIEGKAADEGGATGQTDKF